MLLSQAVINLCAVTGLAPLTGVPLPFVSYGNSSLIISLAAIGLLLNIARANERGVAATKAPAAAPRKQAAGRLRAVDGGRSSPRGRSPSRASSAKGRNSGGGNRRPRRAGHGRRRRAAG
jgi:cell division protein FtsW